MDSLEYLKQWAEIEKKDSYGKGTWDNGYYSAMVDLIDKINELQSRPVGDVEGYLDSTPVYIMSNETKQFVNGQGYVTFEDALAAITEALNVNADKVKNLEEENKRLRDKFNEEIPAAYNQGTWHSRGKYENGQDYYTKTFTNE